MHKNNKTRSTCLCLASMWLWRRKKAIKDKRGGKKIRKILQFKPNTLILIVEITKCAYTEIKVTEKATEPLSERTISSSHHRRHRHRPVLLGVSIFRLLFFLLVFWAFYVVRPFISVSFLLSFSMALSLTKHGHTVTSNVTHTFFDLQIFNIEFESLQHMKPNLCCDTMR